MKIFKFLTLLIFMSVAVFAQDNDSSKRDIPLRVVNKKGRPVAKVIVSSTSAYQAGMTDRTGLFVFKDMTDDDIINVTFPRVGETAIPVAGMDSIRIVQNSARLYSYTSYEVDNTPFEKTLVFEQTKTQSSSIIDVPTLLQEQPSNSLFELLRGQVAGLSLSYDDGRESVAMRGTTSRYGSSEPLVVIDGVVNNSTLADVSRFLNVQDLQTIEVRKTASEYGTRGSNGVILITTKSAFSQ